jgi:HSP20 family protein
MALIELRERLTPFRLLEEIRRDFEELEERLFGSDLLGNGREEQSGRRRTSRPLLRASWGATDIYEQDGKLIYETEMPGVRKEDVSVRMQDGRLIITGEVKRTEEIEEEDYYYTGRHYGRVQRVFALPEEAVEDPKRIEARLENGVLRVVVPLKRSLREAEAIEIKVK